jgi:hypothetical protein
MRLVAAVALATALAAAAAGPAGARRDPALWATVNVCDPPAHPGAVGVRVSMPPRAGHPQEWARIRLQYFDGTARAWRLVRSGGDGGWGRLGSGRRFVQGGTTFTFPLPDPGKRIVLRGLVNVEWRDRGHVVARDRLTTTAGHEDPKDPRLAVSRRSCEIVR